MKRAFGLAAVAVAAVGCTEPQSGVTAAKYWCHAPTANPLPFLDDMEDGDNTACTNRTDGIVGNWQLRTSGATVMVTTPSGPAIVTEADTNNRRSTRAIHFVGSGIGPASTTPPPPISDVWAAVAINFGSKPFALSASPTLSFYGKVGAAGAGGAPPESVHLRVDLVTSATPDCDSGAGVPCTNHLGALALLTPDSGGTGNDDGWTLFTITTFGPEDPNTPPEGDTSAVSEIQFRYAQSYGETARQAPNPNTFDIWIDDVQLTP